MALYANDYCDRVSQINLILKVRGKIVVVSGGVLRAPLTSYLHQPCTISTLGFGLFKKANWIWYAPLTSKTWNTDEIGIKMPPFPSILDRTDFSLRPHFPGLYYSYELFSQNFLLGTAAIANSYLAAVLRRVKHPRCYTAISWIDSSGVSSSPKSAAFELLRIRVTYFVG